MQGFDVRFQIPSNTLVVGPTSSDKTTWLKHPIRHKDDYFVTPPKIMLLFYKEHQKIYDEMEKFMKDGKKDDPVRKRLTRI